MAVSWSRTWLIVTMVPIFISALITSAALTDIFCARLPTVIVSGTRTSCTIGSVGSENACCAAVPGSVAIARMAVLARVPAGAAGVHRRAS